MVYGLMNTITKTKTKKNITKSMSLLFYHAVYHSKNHVIPHSVIVAILDIISEAQWLSGRVLDSRPRGRGFEPHQRHCVVSLSKNIIPSLVLVQPRKTHPFITEKL